MPTKIFISYRRTDSLASAGRLASDLRQAFGDEAVFLDVQSIAPGGDWVRMITEEAASCALLLAVIGPQWLEILQTKTGQPDPDQVRLEIATALTRNLPVLPLCLDRSPMPTLGDLASHPDLAPLCRVNAIRLENTEWSHGLAKVLSCVEQMTGLVSRRQDVEELPARNTLFTGRESLLESVAAALQAGQSVSLCGLPGVGKTEVALEYAHQYAASHHIRLWANAVSEEVLTREFQTLAGQLGLNLAPSLDLASVTSAVRQRLALEKDWLLILDHADDLALMHQLFSGWTQGHLLLTTTQQRVIGLGQRLPVEPLKAEPGAFLLLRRAGRLRETQALADASAEEREAARKISRAVGGLPLLLDQAGAYIEAKSSSPETYWRLYQQKGEKLRGRHEGLRARQHDPAGITFALAFDQIKNLPGASGLLRLCAFLAPDAIPETLLVGGASEFGPELVGALEEEDTREDIIGDVCRFSLLSRDPDQALLSISRLVQDVLKDLMDDAQQRVWAERVVRGVNRCLPANPASPDAIQTWQRLWPHAAAALGLLEQWDPDHSLRDSLPGAYTLNDFAADLRVQEALKAGKGWENLLGPEIDYSSMYAATHFHTLHSLEGEAMQHQMRRVVLSLRRTLTDPREARLAFCCMYFVAHYWWDAYLADDYLCQPLIALWPHSCALPPGDGDEDGNADGDKEGNSDPPDADAHFEEALKTIQADFPPIRDYHTRGAESLAWAQVKGAVTDLRVLLRLNAPAGDISALKPSERFVRAMTNLYLAEATRHVPSEPESLEEGEALWALYAEAAALLEANQDTFHTHWARFDYADALRESADPAHIKAAGEQSRLALKGAIEAAEKNMDEDGIDSEVIANGYRLGADIVAANPATRPGAWAYHCAATLAAYGFLLSEGDAYARAFYAEQRERATERLESLSGDEAAAARKLIAEFWLPYWNNADQAGLPVTSIAGGGLFPPVPSETELKSSRCREAIAQVLEAMPDTVSRLEREFPAYRPPLYFKRVLKCLARIPLDSLDQRERLIEKKAAHV